MIENTAKTYRLTLTACVIGTSATAVAANLLPILFVPLMDLYGLKFGHLGLLMAVYFLSQFISSLFGARLPDKLGLRPLLMLSCAFLTAGFLLLYLSPLVFKNNVLTGLVISAAVYGTAVALLGMMLNPVINALPFSNKHKAMTLFQSAFAAATVIAVAVTSLAAYFLPADAWNYIPLFWCAVPVICFALWIKAPFIQPVAAPDAEPRVLLKNKGFYLAAAAMLTGVAAEIVISSGASAFIEKGLNVNKLLGDMMGPCMFALTFGSGRLLYGLFGGKLNIRNLMVWGSFSCLVLYLSAALIPVTAVSIAALALCGFAVCLLSPGMYSTTPVRFPNSGVWLFAMIYASGAAGSAGGSAVFGVLGGAFDMPALASFAESLKLTSAQLALRLSLLCCAVFPLISLILQIILKRSDRYNASLIKGK